jgi:hypothetical protein
MLLSGVKFPQWPSFCLFRGVDEWIPVELMAAMLRFDGTACASACASILPH